MSSEEPFVTDNFTKQCPVCKRKVTVEGGVELAHECLDQQPEAALEWLRNYHGSIDSTALMLAHEAGQRSTKAEPVRVEEREAVSAAIGAVLFNVMNFPEKVQSRLLGQDMGPLRARLTDAVMPVIERVKAEAKVEGIRVAHGAVRGFQIGDEIDRAIRAAATNGECNAHS